MPVKQPFPDLALLQEEYLLVEAWKKTAHHLRTHNWFADTLAIDRASAELPRFLDGVATRLSDHAGYETRPLRLVPAPKSHTWRYDPKAESSGWEPDPGDEGKPPRLRPLAHANLRDQVAATAILLCLADRVETLQCDPSGSPSDPVHRRRVTSYGNRLFCDVEGADLLYRWGTSSLYRGYFQDYRAFVARPAAAAQSVDAGESRVVVVQSDLRNFYDRVRPELLTERLRDLQDPDDDADFFLLAEKVLKWRWDERDQASVQAYADQEEIPDFERVALPQGLAAAGFFSNVVLLPFDAELRSLVSKEFFVGAHLVDVARYVDDLRIVLKVDNRQLEMKDIEEATKIKLDELLQSDFGLSAAREKTRASEFGMQSDRPIVQQSKRMTRIQKAVSGGFDVAGGEAILEAIRGLMRSQLIHPEEHEEDTEWAFTPVADVPDDTVARFGAARWKRVYRWLRPLLEEEDSYPDDSLDDSIDDSVPTFDELEKTRSDLDNEAEVFAADLIKRWIADPSNVRLLRIAFDIWPSSSSLQEVLNLLKPLALGTGEDEGPRLVAQYCLSELFRAGATETGFVCDPDEIRLNIEGYRSTLQETAEQVIEHDASALPWYLQQQAMLFLATRGSVPHLIANTDPELRHYAALLRFLDDPSTASSATDFATFSVLARHCFAHEGAAPLIDPHITRARLARLVHVDPTFAIEVIESHRDFRWLLPPYIARDLCMTEGLSEDPHSLARLVSDGQNPFRDEMALLQFAIKVLHILRRGQRSVITPADLHIDLSYRSLSDKWAVREGDFRVLLRHRRYLTTSIYSPPDWCLDSERWRFQLGYLLRFVLTERPDFTSSVRRSSGQQTSGESYRSVGMPWKMRRYGFFHGHEAFGDRWLPITEWTTKLLIELLAWPGARTPGFEWVDDGIGAALNAIQERIDKLWRLQGASKSELLLKIEAEPPVTIAQNRPLRAAVVQTVLPQESWFQRGPEDLCPEHRRAMRRHLATALSVVRSSLRLRRTHEDGAGSIDLLIMPELSVHVHDLGILKQFAISHKAMVLAGLVYHKAREDDCQPFVNSAVWMVPEKVREGGRQIRIIEQGKHHLAHSEQGLNVRPFRNGQWLVGFPWSPESDKERLWLTASVCYDATDIGLAADLRGKSDVYVIPALNKDTTTFDQMALALHYHMFQMVIVANSGKYGGSNAYIPYRKNYERQIFHFHGQPQAAVAFVEISDVSEFLNRVETAKDVEVSTTGESKPQFKFPPAGLC